LMKSENNGLISTSNQVIDTLSRSFSDFLKRSENI
jgi:hypothetical protein